MRQDPADLCYSGLQTGMALAVAAEVADRLETLARTGQHSAIDLRSLPLTGADLSELEALLGKGEVEVRLDVVGRTLIWETAYAGAWWIRHLGAGEQVASEQIAITPLPEILTAHQEDITAAAERIRLDLDARVEGATEQEASHG